MDTTIYSQAYIFFSTVYGGVIIGFIYDIYRIFRYFLKPKKVATFLEDLIFWIIVAIIALSILVFSNYGELRGYEFIGFISGAILYQKLLSKPIITFIVNILRFIWKGLKVIMSIVLFPFKALKNILYNPYKKLSNGAKKRYRNIKRKSKLPIRVLSDIKKYSKMLLFRK
ncbi:spore cortex biosynthesis protein YabQ [Dethiothermospora halolimnae]|uniref:spore cortex biosynthesis protein YabQ n=1 Tax=Dethiothermospora halolimnae TaxID=3114390 RepID=UPI003CCC1508